MRPFIADVAQAEGRSPAQVALQSHIPLLVAGEIPVAHQASRRDTGRRRAGIRILQRDRRRAVGDGLGEVECCGKGRIDGDHLLEILNRITVVEDAVSSTQHELVSAGEAVSKAEARPQVSVPAVEQRSRGIIGLLIAQQREPPVAFAVGQLGDDHRVVLAHGKNAVIRRHHDGAGYGVENGQAILGFVRVERDFVAQSEAQGEASGYAPVVLDIAGERVLLERDGCHGRHLLAARGQPQKEVAEGVAGGRHGGGGGECNQAGGPGLEQRRQRGQAKLEAGLESVWAAYISKGIGKRRRLAALVLRGFAVGGSAAIVQRGEGVAAGERHFGHRLHAGVNGAEAQHPNRRCSRKTAGNIDGLAVQVRESQAQLVDHGGTDEHGPSETGIVVVGGLRGAAGVRGNAGSKAAGVGLSESKRYILIVRQLMIEADSELVRRVGEAGAFDQVIGESGETGRAPVGV